jgi:transcriptional regulator with XRE-family HTH domain
MLQPDSGGGVRIEEVIGRWITEGREQEGMTQTELGERVAELLGGKPWSRQAISTAEKGHRAFVAAELVAFALVLKCHIEDLTEPPADIELVTLSDDAPPVPAQHLRAPGADGTGDLGGALARMDELRQEWLTLRTSTFKTDVLVNQAYRELVRALRGRRIAGPEDES